jgi:hypothetical protein
MVGILELEQVAVLCALNWLTALEPATWKHLQGFAR